MEVRTPGGQYRVTVTREKDGEGAVGVKEVGNKGTAGREGIINMRKTGGWFVTSPAPHRAWLEAEAAPWAEEAWGYVEKALAE
jgi:hypothetical protein